MALMRGRKRGTASCRTQHFTQLESQILYMYIVIAATETFILYIHTCTIDLDM